MEVRQALGAGQRPGQVLETVATDGNGRDPQLLDLDGIVDTPRRTGPSVAHAVDHGITLTRKFADLLEGQADQRLLGLDCPRGDPVLLG